MRNKPIQKMLSVLLIAILSLAVLSGCGQGASQTEQTASGQSETAPESAEGTESAEASESAQPASDAAVETAAIKEEGSERILVVSFSCTGNTKPIAEMAAEILNADFYEIVPEIPYTDEDLEYHNDNCRANKEQNDDTARPAIAGDVPELSDYDTILISFPIWWGKEPRIIDTFMEACDFSGKNLAAFCTSGGSGIDTAENNLKAYAPDAEWLGAMRFQAGASADTLTEWLGEIGLITQGE